MFSTKKRNESDGNHPPAQKHKKHDANLQKNGLLPFQIGLVLSLLVVYFIIEVQVPQKPLADVQHDPIDEEYAMIDVPIYRVFEEVQEQQKQQKKVRLTDTYVIDEEDDPKKIEAVIDVQPSTTTDPNFNPNDVKVVDPVDPDLMIDFIRVEEAPMFEVCATLAKDDRRACFQEQINKHVKRHLRYPDLAVELGQQGRVDVGFVIDAHGNIIDVKVRGPHTILEKEAVRIISKLPKMIPGKQRNVPVKVPFSLPIYFRLQ